MPQGPGHKVRLLLLALAASALFVTPALWFLWRLEAGRYDAARRAAVADHLDEVRLSLRAALDARLAFLKAIAACAASNPEITPGQFESFAAALARDVPAVRALQLARDAVVSHVYPRSANPGILGLDLVRNLPLPQRAALVAVLEHGGVVVAGPVDLLQGGRGLIARTAVRAEGTAGLAPRLWGVATVIIDADAFFREAGLERDADIRVAVREQNGDDAPMVFGDPAVFAGDPMTTSLEVPGGGWLLGATPRGGWTAMPPPPGLIAAGTGAWLALAVAFFLLASWPARLSRAVALATRTLDAANADLERTVAARTAELTRLNEALRQGEARYRAFIDATGDMAFLKDASLRHLVANRPLAAFFGKTPEEVIGLTDYELMPAELAARCHASDVAARDGREVVATFESVDERTFEARKFPVPLGEGVTGVGGYIRDISDRLRAELALRRSEEALRDLYANAPVGIFTSTPDGRYLKANDRLARMYGYDDARAMLAAVTDIRTQVYPDPDERAALLKALRTRDHLANYEVRRLTRTGEVIWVSLNIRAVRDPSGEISRFEGFCTDITKRKLAEENLARRERQLRVIFDNSPLGLVFFDETGVVVNCNGRLLDLLGLTPEQMIGHNVLGRMPAYVREALQRALGGEPAATEGLYTSVISGKSCHVRAIFNPVEAGRAPTPVIASVEDISAMRDKDASLRLLWAAVEQSPASIVITDPKGVIEYVNPHFSVLTGYTPEEALGQTPRLLKSDAHPDAFYREMWQTLAAGEIWRGELCNRKKNGELYWEDSSISPVRDDSGAITHYVAVKEDITERRKLERVREDVERIMRHDLKTPLNSIVNLPQIVQVVGQVNEEQQELLGEIERAGQSMLEQIELSMDLYRMETGTYVLEAQHIDLARIVSGAAEMLSGLAKSRGVELYVEANGPTFAAGSALLSRNIAANLLKNAVEAEPEGGQVSARLAREADRVVLTVANPTPVPPDIVPVFFEKYATGGKRGGTGLGAYSARIMTLAQHGDIRLETDPAGGTRVVVSLPAA
ncbi:PAS domain S-box protein [Solidesulfovibrio sp.]|uniref:PAS domain S-box protein n=1 Tax=Solidesulfovibrio sp. TaxID=2910990 RepID=UPI0026143209|nr:PAS domain S-box protein [Solidesulfovibrio sp.]